LQVAIFTKNRNSWPSQRLFDAFQRRNAKTFLLSLSRVAASVGLSPQLESDGVELEELDAAVVRPIGRGSLEQIVFRLDVLHKLSRMGVTIVNHPSSIERAVDKYHSLAILHEKGIPVPRTVVTEDVDRALAAFRQMGEDVVVKPIFGSRGVGSARITNPDVAERIFRTVRFQRELIYVQEFIPHGLRDIRALVVGDRILAAMARRSDSWKTNISLGARPEKVELSGELQELSIRATKVMGCEIAGVDIMEGDRGPLFTEINSQPGWKGLQSVTEINIADEIAAHVLRIAKS